MAELANAFIRPTGGNAFEVIDPSVIDPVSAVVRKPPEKLVIGAVDFSQIERVWKIGEGGFQTLEQLSSRAAYLLRLLLQAL
ncbi:hypothetical protein ACVWWO_000093 [Bradyrhizobium sp. F1.13.1]|jgi:hypothetical protein